MLAQPAKSLKSNTGGGCFCGIGIQYTMPYSQKYTPPHCFFSILPTGRTHTTFPGERNRSKICFTISYKNRYNFLEKLNCLNFARAHRIFQEKEIT